MIPWSFLYQHNPEAFSPLKVFAGAVIALKFPLMNEILQIQPSGALIPVTSLPPTTHIQGTSLNPKALTITGDMMLAQAFDKTCTALRCNAGALLDGVLGEKVSSHLTPPLQRACQGVLSFIKTHTQTLADTLQYEKPFIAPAPLMLDFIERVECARHQIERLQKRLECLEFPHE
jgi:ubiquinone biosynthesis protein UbiJ